MFRATLTAFALAVATPAAAQTNLDHELNLVWKRLADIKGEFGSVESSEFSPDGQFIVSGSKFDNTVRKWRTEDGFLLWKTVVPAEIERVAWTADGSQVVSVSEDAVMRVIDAETGKILIENEFATAMDSLSLSPDGKYMAVGEEMIGAGSDSPSGTAAVLVYDTSTWEEVLRLDQQDTANEIDWHPDSSRFVVVGGKTFRIWDAETGEELVHNSYFPSEIPRKSTGFVCVKWSPDGRVIVAGAGNGDLHFYDGETGEYIRFVNKTGDKIETVEFTQDSKYVLSAGRTRNIEFISVDVALNTRLRTGSVPIALRVPVSDALEYMDFNADGSLLTTAHQDGTIQLWTYMSDQLGVNQFSHSSLKEAQAEAFD